MFRRNILNYSRFREYTIYNYNYDEIFLKFVIGGSCFIVGSGFANACKNGYLYYNYNNLFVETSTNVNVVNTTLTSNNMTNVNTNVTLTQKSQIKHNNDVDIIFGLILLPFYFPLLIMYFVCEILSGVFGLVGSIFSNNNNGIVIIR